MKTVTSDNDNDSDLRWKISWIIHGEDNFTGNWKLFVNMCIVIYSLSSFFRSICFSYTVHGVDCFKPVTLLLMFTMRC